MSKIEDVQIYRKPFESGSWTQVGTVNKLQTYYEDYTAEVLNMAYEYKVLPNYVCSWTVEGGESNSIYLEVQESDIEQKFTWNPYVKWTVGVDYYELQIFKNGFWQTEAIIPSGVTEYRRY